METNKYKPLHVLMTADTAGGVWTYSLQLIQAMAPYNISFTLVTMGASCSLNQKSDIKKLTNVSLIESNYLLEWMDDPWQDVDMAGALLLELEKKLQPDIIHLNNYAHGALPFKAPKIMVAHSCIYSWWHAVHRESPPSRFTEYFLRVKKGLSSVNYVIAPSYSMLSALNQYYGSFRMQSVIPNAHDPAFFKPDQKCPFIFTMGRLWDQAKNISVLETVAEKLSWPTFIAGENIEPEATRKFTMDNTKACFLGTLSREEISRQLSKASVFVLPAKYEPFGLSILEAASSGCALVLGDIPSLRENWNGAAAFVDPDNPEEIKEVLQALISHPSQREKLAEQALQRARAFSPEKMAGSYYTIYNDLTPLSINLETTKIHENNSVLS